MVQKKKPDILEEKDFEETSLGSRSSKPKKEKEEDFSVTSTTSSSEMMSTLIRIVTPVLVMVGVLAIVWVLFSWLTGDDSSDSDTADDIQVSQADEDEEDPEPVQQVEEEPTEDEAALEFVKFEELAGGDFMLTGRVTDVYDDRAFDGNAGLIIEGEYRVDTQYGGGSSEGVTLGEIDNVAVGDWVEVLAQGRKSFSSTASYLLDVFASDLYVKGIENPVTGAAVVGSTETDEDTSEDNSSDDEDTSNSDGGPITNVSGGDDVTITKAAIEAGSKLTLTLKYPGCGQHDFGINRISIDTDEPREVVVQVAHDANGDTCEKSNTSVETFDISEHLEEFDGQIPYDIEIRGSSSSNKVNFTVG